MKRLFFILIVILTFLRISSGQEVLFGVGSNAEIKKYCRLYGPPKQYKSSGDTLYLPFYDDFANVNILFM
ncbi:MAG: hypothetical protein HY738_08845 [Bacteroidia bacterium]|nr:hypothetical protein [Bacteroidia bacterium]